MLDQLRFLIKIKVQCQSNRLVVSLKQKINQMQCNNSKLGFNKNPLQMRLRLEKRLSKIRVKALLVYIYKLNT